jgi:hypothetical protein
LEADPRRTFTLETRFVALLPIDDIKKEYERMLASSKWGITHRRNHPGRLPDDTQKDNAPD